MNDNHPPEGASASPRAQQDAPAAAGPPSEAGGGRDDLGASLAALSQLATGQMELTDVLTRVAEFAVRAIPGADGAGLTLLDGARHDSIVASATFVVGIDAIQYGINQGPCITAAAEARTVCSASLDTDERWPKFGPRVARLGVHSALSLPLITGTGVVGAMNVYAHERNAFTDHEVEIGELFAAPAAIAVQNAQVLAQTKRLVSQLQTALTTRATIDYAIGLLMGRLGCGPDEAFDRLRQISQAENRKLHAVAQNVVAEAVRRAQARNNKT